MKIETLLQEGRERLKHLGTFSTALDTRLLLQAAANLTHEDIIAEPTRQVSEEAATLFSAFIVRRLAHEPVSRIRGRREFYGREYRITADVLDPRPDTEVVVELALKHIKRGRFIDLGTGSGAIAITLCAEVAELSGIATDVSAAALAVASGNAHRLGVTVRLNFHQGAWFDGVDGLFDLIISNPPYIGTKEILPTDVVNFDPHLALFASENGLAAYRVIANQSATHLSMAGLVVMEVGHDQNREVEHLFKTQGFICVDQALDLAGHVRGLAFKLPQPR